MVRAASAIANGGFLLPHISKRDKEKKSYLTIGEQNQVRILMQRPPQVKEYAGSGEEGRPELV